MKGFRNLIVWQKSHQLALAIYEVTKSFPSEEKFGLISQIRRACLSIPTNIAEDTGRKSEKETIQFFSIARGSANEVDYLIEFSNSPICMFISSINTCCSFIASTNMEFKFA